VAKRKFRCSDCGYTWEIAYGKGRPSKCPECGSLNIHREEEDRGYARFGGRGRGRGWGRGCSFGRA